MPACEKPGWDRPPRGLEATPACFCPMGNIFAVSASDDRRERGEGRRRWDPRERGTRETRPTPRLRTNFEVSIQLGVPQWRVCRGRRSAELRRTLAIIPAGFSRATSPPSPATVATDIESLFGGHAHQRAPGDRNHAFRQSSRRALIYMPRWNLHLIWARASLLP